MNSALDARLRAMEALVEQIQRQLAALREEATQPAHMQKEAEPAPDVLAEVADRRARRVGRRR